MGKTYLLNKNDFIYDEKIKNEIILKEILTEEEASKVLAIQEVITTEIDEEISQLTKDSLVVKNPFRSEGLIFGLAIEDGECVGYGYGYIENENVFYLDTIGVHPDYRGKKIGTEIKVRLVEHAFNDLKIPQVKAITQAQNERTIHINEKIGFRDSIVQNNEF